MNGIPPGDWTELLVGHVLPAEANLDIVDSASTHFGNIAMTFRSYEEGMHRAWSGTLASQDGCTADTGRSAFQHGERLACDTAEKYETIQCSNESARNSASALRSELLTIAANGNFRIKAIQESEDSLPIKIGKITEVVVDCQTQANGKAAACAGNMLSDIQHILDKHGLQTSAQKFASDNGFDPTRMFGSPNTDTIRKQVETTLDKFGSPEGTQALGNPVPPPEAPALPAGSPPASRVGPAATDIPPLSPASTATSAAIDPAPNSTPVATKVGPSATELSPRSLISVPATAGSTTSAVPTPSSPPVATPGMPGPPLSPVTAGGLPVATPMPTPAPTSLAQSFTQGFQTGAPIGAAAVPPPTPTLSDAAMPMTPHVAQTFPSAAHSPIIDVPSHTPAVSTPPPAALPPDGGGTYLASAPPPPTPITGAAAPVGPLPTYGSDIRPTAPTAPPAPTTPAGPTPATPSSAPSNSHISSNQPAVVRRSTAPVAPQTSHAMIGTQAVAASSVGAIAGHTSAQETSRTRLHKLLNAVARQEPRLSWAVGDRPDQITILVTDLASGWIPPGIDIPTGITLLEPAHRRGDTEALLGEVTMTAAYTPGQQCPTTDEALPTSPRSRHGLVVDELGWELGQATKWRDGLPRLAHTLASAAARGTGVLPSEIDLLREHLDTTRSLALQDYPHSRNTAAIENWQLLATIEALALGDRSQACYHFTWFQVLSHVPTGGRSK